MFIETLIRVGKSAYRNKFASNRSQSAPISPRRNPARTTIGPRPRPVIDCGPKDPVKTPRKFTVLIEEDEDGWLVATVPALRGCHTQAKSLDTLMKRVREVIALCLDGETDQSSSLELVGIHQVTV
jgi:predicted RNase H-like HicB family nuclease